MEDVSELLKRQRVGRKISIRALAEKAGVSAAMISRIEQGHASPSFATLQKILRVFGISFAEFFAADEEKALDPVIRKNRIRKTSGIGEKLKVMLINSEKSSALQLFVEEYEPGGNSGREFLTHDSEEAGYCLEGEFILELGGKKYEISAGDGWHFDSNIPHRFSNPSKTKRAVLVSTNTPAVF